MTCAPRPSRRRRGITTRAPALFVMIFCGALLAGHQGETSSELHGRGLTPALQGQPGLLHKSLRLRGGKVEAEARLPELSVCDHTEGGVYIDPRAVAPEISELRAPKRSRSPLEPRESGRSPSAFSAARVKDDDAEGEEVTSSSDLVRKRSASGSPTVRAPSPRPNTALHRLRGNYGQTCAPPTPPHCMPLAFAKRRHRWSLCGWAWTSSTKTTTAARVRASRGSPRAHVSVRAGAPLARAVRTAQR